jgi:hypothetical protein
MERMRRIFLVNAGRNLRLTRMMDWVFDLLSAEGIAHIPIKGPVLAERLYGDTALRQFTDLDILIHPQDYLRCHQVITAAGFEAKFPHGVGEERWLLRADTAQPYTYKGDILDIHWAIAGVGIIHPLRSDHFWQHLEHTQLGGRGVLSLNPENLFLMLCIHGTKHMWRKLAWIADLARFTETYPDFDWVGALDRAAAVGFQRLLNLGLHLAVEIGGAHIPPHVVPTYDREPTLEKLANQAMDIISGETAATGEPNFRYYQQARERLGDRTYSSLFRAFVPKQADWLAMPLPKFLYPLYYLLRPVRLMIEFGPRLFKSIFRRSQR